MLEAGELLVNEDFRSVSEPQRDIQRLTRRLIAAERARRHDIRPPGGGDMASCLPYAKSRSNENDPVPRAHLSFTARLELGKQ